MTRLGSGAPGLAIALAAALLGGCAGAPSGGGTVSGGPGPGTPSGRSDTAANDPASAERRARVRLELAGLYFSRGQVQTALDELRQALAASPDLPEAHGLLGLIHASQGDAKGADESFRRALQINPRDADVMHNYGWFLCQQRRFDEADGLFERASNQPQYGEVVRTLLARGVCQARAGHWAEAERLLGRSYELDPANPVTAYNLSEVLMRRGELERARFYVRRINQVPELVTAQSLWLAVRIERRLGNMDALQDQGRQLRERFPQSPEALRFESGQFED